MEAEMGSDLESFLQWAAKLGISDSPTKIHNPETPRSCLGRSLSVSNFPEAGGRGLAAVRNIRRGEMILRVPKSALITWEALLKDHKLSLALKNHPSLSSTQMLAICLLAEMGRGKSSSWYPYLVQLPRSYDLLASFSQFEVQALQVDEAIWNAERAVAKADLEWREAVEILQKLRLKPQLRTLKAWVWAISTISSRTLHIPWDDAGCLCPVGDFFNYAAPGEELAHSEGAETPSNSSHLHVGSLENGIAIEKLDFEQFNIQEKRLIDAGYEEDVAAYCFYARKCYKKGEQVLLSYGMYTNLELLDHYGFLLADNPNDKVFMPLLPEIFTSSSWPEASIYVGQNGQPSFALLSALRLWATPPSQRKSARHLVYSGSQLSLENEISTMNIIVTYCCNILKNLPTSVEEDNLMLCAFDKMQNCSTLVELEKLQLGLRGEISMFLEADCSLSGEDSGAEMSISKRLRKSMERWKLAVQWRMRYKKTLVDCIAYCSKVLDSLSKHVASMKDRR